jgi:hypothetical protein
MSGEQFFDRDVIVLMGRERHARAVALDRHHYDDRGRRVWTWEALEECEGILDWEDGIDEGGRRDASPDGPE